MSSVQLVDELDNPNSFGPSPSLGGPSISFDLGYEDRAEHDIIGLKDSAYIIDEGVEPGVLSYMILD